MIVSHHLQQRHGRRDLRQGRIAQAATAARWTIGLSLKAAQRFCDTLPLIYHYEVAVRSSICGAKILKLPCLLRVMNRQNPMLSHVRLASDSGPMTDIGRVQFRASFRQSASQQTSALFHHLVGIIRGAGQRRIKRCPRSGPPKIWCEECLSRHTRRLCSSRISSAILIRDRCTSSAKGALGRHERHGKRPALPQMTA
jgi:hypothetical protein